MSKLQQALQNQEQKNGRLIRFHCSISPDCRLSVDQICDSIAEAIEAPRIPPKVQTEFPHPLVQALFDELCHS